LRRFARALSEAQRGRLSVFGDLAGNFDVLDAANGQKLWSRPLGSTISGSARANDRQRHESHGVVRT
jgi:outer membrane protein assembly factor BamB